jgi:hypothetical protein
MATPGTFYSIYDIKNWRNPPPPQKKISIGKKNCHMNTRNFLFNSFINNAFSQTGGTLRNALYS